VSEQLDEDLEGIDSVFSGGLDVGADGHEAAGASLGAKAARHPRLEAGHTQVSLRLVVVEADGKVVDEAEHLVFVVPKGDGEVVADPLGPAPLAAVGRVGVGVQGNGDDGVVAGAYPRPLAGRDFSAPASRAASHLRLASTNKAAMASAHGSWPVISAAAARSRRR